MADLKKNNLVDKNAERLRVLGNGEIKKAVKVVAYYASESAKAKIEAAGGEVVLG